MLKMNFDKVKYITRGKAILDDLKKHPEKMDKLEELLRKNDFSDIADLAIELRDKYL